MNSDRATEQGPSETGAHKQSAFRIAEHLRASHGTDGATVLDILHGQMFRLNMVGSRILELLKEGCGEAEIADRVAAEFAVNPRDVEADLHEFLLTLRNHALVSLRDGEPLA